MLKAPIDVLDKIFALSTSEGGCSFKDFVRLMDVLCRGSPTEKIGLFFRVFDSGQKRYLDWTDGLTFLTFLEELATKSAEGDLPDGRFRIDHLFATPEEKLTLPQFTNLLATDTKFELLFNLILTLMTANIAFVFQPDQVDELAQWQWTQIEDK